MHAACTLHARRVHAARTLHTRCVYSLRRPSTGSTCQKMASSTGEMFGRGRRGARPNCFKRRSPSTEVVVHVSLEAVVVCVVVCVGLRARAPLVQGDQVTR